MAPACRVEAVRAEGLNVSAGDLLPFEASVSDGALAFVPGGDDRHLTAEVERPLRFTATARTDEQRLVLARAAELAAGGVRAVAGQPVLALSPQGAGLIAHVQLGRGAPPAGRALELSVGPVAVACDDVITEPDPEPRVATALPRHVPGGELRVAATSPLVVRPVRLAPARVEVRGRGQGAFVPVWVVDRQGDDVRAVIAFSDGARVEGWVPVTVLREPSAAEAEAIERLVSSAVPETMALGLLGILEATQPGAQAEEYVGPASLRPGSAVHAEPGGARWAESGEHPLEVRVRWQRGSAHAQLLEVPGMWAPPERAWVQRGDVSLPEP